MQKLASGKRGKGYCKVPSKQIPQEITNARTFFCTVQYLASGELRRFLVTPSLRPLQVASCVTHPPNHAIAKEENTNRAQWWCSKRNTRSMKTVPDSLFEKIRTPE